MSYLSRSNFNHYTIAFYNLENLFDTHDDPKTLDDDFTKHSSRRWNEKRFRKKIRKIGKVISQIGYENIWHPPVITGIAEVENKKVLNDLIHSKFLKNKGYQYIHFDSPDERGIDTALLFREKYFKIIHQEAVPLYVDNEDGMRDYTRDILYVKGILVREPIHLLVNHWPSRRAGSQETAYKRIEAANKNLEIISEIMQEEPDAKIIVMGDFNDDPISESIQQLKQANLFNPMEQLHTRYSGSLNYRGTWNLFDQIILSPNFLRHHGDQLRFEEAKIFNPKHLQEFKGSFKGNPFRTFIGKKYLGGLSDHFPVYGVLSLKKSSE